MKHLILFGLICLLVFALPGIAVKARIETPDPQNLDELEQGIRKVLEDTHTPGASVALVDRDKILWIGGIGQADVAAGKQVGPETQFRIGSITKTFVSLAALKLQEQGKLRIEDRLHDLAPEIAFTNPWEATDPVRLEHLLEHTAGFEDLRLNEFTGEPASTLRDAVAINSRPRTVRWPPGSYFSYSNPGPAVAAYVVEKVSGQRFEDYVQQNFFDPLEMHSASFFRTPSVQANLSKSYQSDGLTEIPYSFISLRPSGAVSATPGDMAHFVQMFLNRGTYHGAVLLKPESILRMETPTTNLAAREGIRTGSGLSKFVTPLDGFLYYGHRGVVDGFMASYETLPEQGLGYFFAINALNGEASNLIDRLIRRYLTRDLARPEAPSQKLPAAQLEQQLQQFTGFYESITPPVQLARLFDQYLSVVKVQLQDGKLWVKPLLIGEATELIPVAERQFRASEDPVASMVFIRSGTSGWIMQGFGNAISSTYRSIAPWSLWLRFGLIPLSLVLMISAVLYALVWVPVTLLREARNARDARKARHVQYRSVQVLSLVASLLGLLIIYGFVSFIAGDPMHSGMRFGRITPWSVGFWILTWLFALSAIALVVQVVRTWHWRGERVFRIYTLLVCLGNMVILLYLASFNIIGLRTWT